MGMLDSAGAESFEKPTAAGKYDAGLLRQRHVNNSACSF